MRIISSMFTSLLSLCSRKELQRASIYSCFNEYKKCYDDVVKKDKNFHAYMDSTKWDKLSPETQELVRVNERKQHELVEELVTLVKAYCKKYPDEEICHHCNFKSYDEYPYRLPQSIEQFIRLL